MSTRSTDARQRCEPELAAESMLKRYSSPRVALEMAHWHRADYREGTDPYEYWTQVLAELRRKRSNQR
jgi:hypothetical protein